MNTDEVRADVDALLARKAIRQESHQAVHRAADLIDAGDRDRDVAEDVLVFASWYSSARTRQLTRALYSTLLTWVPRLMEDDDFAE